MLVIIATYTLNIKDLEDCFFVCLVLFIFYF